MQEHTISVARTAKYCQVGEITNSTEHIWFVCHGYGQLAKYFIQNFEGMVDDKTAIIAPEALSRFYVEGFSGRVGASWMTTEERLAEIDDYVAYLDSLYMKLATGNNIGSTKVTVLGFSQGVATAARWIAKGIVKPSRLILWAGTPPDEFIAKEASERLTQLKLILVYGSKDKFIPPGKLRDVKDLLAQNNIQFEVHVFDGGHTLNEQILLKLKNL